MALKVTLEIENGRYRTTIDFGAGPVLFVSSDDIDSLSNFRRRYVLELHQARLDLGSANPKCTVRQASTFLKTVHDLGSELQQKLFGEHLSEVSRLFVDILHPLVIDPPKTEARLILLDTGGLFFPLEMLPLLDPRAVEPSDHVAYLALRARSFVGMSAVVHRVLRREMDQEQVLACSPKLPVKVFYHADLAGAHDEIKFFRDRHVSIALDGPWPPKPTRNPVGRSIGTLWRRIGEKVGVVSSQTSDEQAKRERDAFARAFTGFLMDPGRSFDGSAREPPDQICHFSCHASTAAQPGDYRLIVKGAGGAEASVTIGEIQKHISQRSAEQRPQSLPFVFLNACSTGVSQPGDFARFENLFAGTHHRGLITTETNVPDRFAAALAQLFYDSLLGKFTVGQSLHIARWHMLTLKYNPLGLLYYIYGNPYLSLRPLAPAQPAAAQA
jgi:hypothetical protein